jgi:phospholipid transport system substrate-binding protein
MAAIVVILTPVVSLISFAQEVDVKKFVDQVAQSLINTMKNASTSLESKRSQVKQVIEKNFDVAWMSRFAMGVNYKKLSDAQKERYASLYLNYLLNNYFPILMKYDSDDSYEILKINKVDEKDHDVGIKLLTKKSENPIMLQYRVRFVDGAYKCLDMSVEGVSTLLSQRAEFVSVIQQSGIDAFLKQLESQKVKS